MITALTEKLGQETIFNIIQTQMYGTENSRQQAQQSAEPRGVHLLQEHGCATTETSSPNLDNVRQIPLLTLVSYHI